MQSPGMTNPYATVAEPAPPGALAASPSMPPAVDNSLTYPAEQPSTSADQARQAQAAGPDFYAALEAIRHQLEQGQLAEGHLALSYWFHQTIDSPDQHRQVLNYLDQVTGTVVYSQAHLLEPAYEIQPGDTLERIASLYEVPWQLLAKINGIPDPNNLQPGGMIKVVRGPFQALVDKDRHELTLWLDERYAGRFSIGIGRDGSTPVGTFVVKAKIVNPTYYGPDGVIDADSPDNPLGERWIDLGNQIGLHGTNDADSIGQSESRGCIRLSARDVEDVFDILSIGSQVVIRR